MKISERDGGVAEKSVHSRMLASERSACSLARQ